VTCHVTDLGSFDLLEGSGTWSVPDPGRLSGVAVVRLVDRQGGVDAQLFEDVAEMGVDGVGRDEEFLGYLAVGVTFRRQATTDSASVSDIHPVVGRTTPVGRRLTPSFLSRPRSRVASPLAPT
jgi:hypothetical protein